jgi:hypothetical protein
MRGVERKGRATKAHRKQHHEDQQRILKLLRNKASVIGDEERE